MHFKRPTDAELRLAMSTLDAHWFTQTLLTAVPFIVGLLSGRPCTQTQSGFQQAGKQARADMHCGDLVHTYAETVSEMTAIP